MSMFEYCRCVFIALAYVGDEPKKLRYDYEVQDIDGKVLVLPREIISA